MDHWTSMMVREYTIDPPALLKGKKNICHQCGTQGRSVNVNGTEYDNEG